MSIAIAIEMSGANCQSPSAKNILIWKKNANDRTVKEEKVFDPCPVDWCHTM